MSTGPHYSALPLEDCFSIVKEGNAESLFIPPKALNIVWGNDRRYWQWRALNYNKQVLQGPNHGEVVELLQVNWVQVTGRLDCSKMGGFLGGYLFPPRPKTYEIFWVVKFNADAFGWHNVPIKFKVAAAAASGGGRYKQWSENLEAYRRRSDGHWHEIKGGEFTVSPGGKGLFDFGMFETESDWWKGGMVLAHVKVKPKA